MSKDRVVYQEFAAKLSGKGSTNKACDRPDPLSSAKANSELEDLPNNQQNLRVQVSRKGRNGKTVTVISGFQLAASSKVSTLETLLKQLKNQCGAGGTVREEANGSQIEIQGDHSQKILQILQKLAYKVKISGG